MGREIVTPVEVRYRDVDSMGHVNNSTYATFLEQACAVFFRNVLSERLDRVDTVLVTLTIDFLVPITVEDDVEVRLLVTDVGTSSLTMQYEVRDGDRVYATAETVLVLLDPASENPASLPDVWREAIDDGDGSRQSDRSR